MGFQLLPVLAPMMMKFLVEKQEGEIYMLSKSMGLQLKTVIAFIFVICNIYVVGIGIPLLAIVKAIIFKHSSVLLLFFGLVIFTQALIMSLVFFLFCSGQLGVVLFLLIQLFVMII